jgi:hypothetical protein
LAKVANWSTLDPVLRSDAAYQTRLHRVPFDRPIRISSGQGAELFRAGNLSLGGMFVQAERPPVVGDLVQIALEAGSRTLPLGQAEVVWRRSGSNPGEQQPLPRLGFGLKFLNLEPGARSLVEAVVKHGGTSSARVSPDDEPTQPGRTPPPTLDEEPKTTPGSE